MQFLKWIKWTDPNPAVDHVWTWLYVVMATQTVLTNQMRSSVDLPPLCPCVYRGSFSVPMESACQPAVCVMDGWTVVLLMGLMRKVMYHSIQQYTTYTVSAILTHYQTKYSINISLSRKLLCWARCCYSQTLSCRDFFSGWHSFNNLAYWRVWLSVFLHVGILEWLLFFNMYVMYMTMWWPVLLLVQIVVWFVTRGNSCVLEDVAFSISTAVMDMMTVGTSVMRGGMFSVLLNFAISNCQWLNGLPFINMLCRVCPAKDANFNAFKQQRFLTLSSSESSWHYH